MLFLFDPIAIMSPLSAWSCNDWKTGICLSILSQAMVLLLQKGDSESVTLSVRIHHEGSPGYSRKSFSFSYVPKLRTLLIP